MYDENTEATYREAGFGASVPRGARPALVVVDLTRGFTSSDFPLGADLTDVVESTNTVIAAARDRGLPVVFTRIAYTDAEARGASVAWLNKSPGLRSLLEGSAAAELDPRLARERDDVVITKKGASAFFGTGIAATLVALGADTIVVCGATTSGCVRASVVDGVQSGFPVLVVRQCVGDRAEGPHEANLFDIDQKYGDVVELGDAVSYLASCGIGDGVGV